MVRYRKSAARSKRPKERKIAPPQPRAIAANSRTSSIGKAAASTQGRRGAVQKASVRGSSSTRAQMRSFRWDGNAAVNLLIAVVAAVAMLLVLYVVLVRPQFFSFDGPARDSSGNEVIQVPGRVPISQSFPEDGFEFDQAAIDAVLKPLAATSKTAPDAATLITDANGNVVPTDPVRYAMPAGDVTATAGDGRRALARGAPAARSETRPERSEAGSNPAHSGTNINSATTGGSFDGKALIAEARRYLGTNPTKRATLWCGAFLDMVLRRTGHPGGGNLALAYARYGKRISGPRVGAIVVLRRNGGGHVGIVTGVDSNGNPIVISGNHGRKVGVGVYPRSRVVAYVVPRT